jgi:polar amino acid transport system substrate-binding protein
MAAIRLFACTLLLAGAWACPAHAIERIKAHIYYTAAPFITEEATRSGLAMDLVNYLNRALAGKYEIELDVVPRARLAVLLEQGDAGVVLFVPSVIFGGIDGGKYLWSAPLFLDRQELVSRHDQPFEFTGPPSLHNVRMGGVLGHSYPMLDAAIATGQIEVRRNMSEAALLKMLRYRRLDVVTLAGSSLRYYQNADPVLKDMFHVSRAGLGEYSRHLMFQENMKRQRDDFDAVVGKMGADLRWQAILAKYGLLPAACGLCRPADPHRASRTAPCPAPSVQAHARQRAPAPGP